MTKRKVQTSAQVKCHNDEKKCWHQSWDLINEQIYTGSPIDSEWQTLRYLRMYKHGRVWGVLGCVRVCCVLLMTIERMKETCLYRQSCFWHLACECLVELYKLVPMTKRGGADFYASVTMMKKSVGTRAETWSMSRFTLALQLILSDIGMGEFGCVCLLMIERT